MKTDAGPGKTGWRSRRAPSRPHPACGFTLVELLVVVSIIALLIAILLPSLRRARDQSKLTACVAHMRGNGEAAFAFTTEYGRFQLVSDEVGIASADPDRRRYAYGDGGELLSWPVALARASNANLRNNWDWGVRAVTFDEASQKKDRVNRDLGMMLCPADRVRVATPFYPRNKPLTIGAINNDGLRGTGNPADPAPSTKDMSYWGLLSYAANEDVAGAEVAESQNAPACWRSVTSGGACTECKGEFSYPPFHACGNKEIGKRLQGNLDRIFRPGDVGLLFEAGRDDVRQDITGYANLTMTSKATGPYLADFQQAHTARMPTNRHPRGTLNVLYADLHGGSVRPVKFDATNKLPTEYTPSVRVSPYPPTECD